MQAAICLKKNLLCWPLGIQGKTESLCLYMTVFCDIKEQKIITDALPTVSRLTQVVITVIRRNCKIALAKRYNYVKIELQTGIILYLVSEWTPSCM